MTFFDENRPADDPLKRGTRVREMIDRSFSRFNQNGNATSYLISFRMTLVRT
jgi:hypothetical protein